MDPLEALAARLPRLPQLNPLQRYLGAVAAVALTTALQEFVLDRPSIAPFVLFFLGIAVVSSLAGALPGLLAVALSSLAANVLFIDPLLPQSRKSEAIPATALFVASAASVALLCAFLRRTWIVLSAVQHDLNRAQQVARIGSWRLDVQRNVLAWSDESHRIFGLPAGTPLTYEGFLAAVHPEDRARVDAAWRAATVGGAPYDIEHRILVDGAVKWVHELAELEFDDAGTLRGGFGTVQDVTERKAVERELAAARLSAERARTSAEDANKAKDRFLAVLSHELRNPLAPVLTGIALLEREAVSERGQHVVQVVRRNVELEARLIDDLLDLTRIAHGKLQLQRQTLELCTVIERAVEVCRPDIDARRLHFGIDYGPRPYVLEADAARLQQVFWNLLKNAVKFTPHEGCVGIRCRPSGSEVVVEVNDSGVGIEPAALASIFDAFSREERTGGQQFGGLGLGLAISRSLAELHGGRIEAASEGPGRGATFRVCLPILSHGVPAGGAVVAEPPAIPEPTRQPLRVFLVEDHGDAAETMVIMLGLAGHEVDSAADVATALDRMARERFDILVSDLGLPDRSGLELLRALRARGDAIPAIALTGYGLQSDLEQTRAAGFAAHLVKPVDPRQLLATIDRVLGRSAPGA